MRDFKKLKIWEKSFELAIKVYKLTSIFPKDERFGLTSQLRRASISISTNIAEGSNRNSDKDFSRFLNISIGSIAEVESLLMISNKLGNYLTKSNLEDILSKLMEARKMIFAFQKTLKSAS